MERECITDAGKLARYIETMYFPAYSPENAAVDGAQVSRVDIRADLENIVAFIRKQAADTLVAAGGAAVPVE